MPAAVYLVLDTNALPNKKGNIASGFWGSVLALCALKGIRPAISEVVLDESINMIRDSAETMIEQFVSAHAGLSQLVEVAPIYAPDAVAIANSYDTMLRERFAILPLDAGHAREALRREALRIPPASKGRGGRDTAIWLTVADLVKAGHTVHFVTNNSDDFGKGALLPALLAEISGFEHGVHYHVDVNAFLDTIAARVPVPSVSEIDVRVSFDKSLRLALVERLGDGADGLNRWWGVLTDDYDVTDVKVGHAYNVDGRGLARVTATFQLGALGGTFTGWLAFELESGAPAPSEVDNLFGLAVG